MTTTPFIAAEEFPVPTYLDGKRRYADVRAVGEYLDRRYEEAVAAFERARDRRLSDDEIERLLFALGYDYDATPATATARVGAALLFAIETAMRAGEIVGLTWDRVNPEGCCCRLPLTKNGTAREVPLSAEALRILRQLPRGEGKVFGLSGDLLDALFRKAKARAMIEDLHFHDARHEAITRLSKKLDVLDLARMVGIRDLRILMVYYNATATEIAGRLG